MRKSAPILISLLALMTIGLVWARRGTTHSAQKDLRAPFETPPKPDGDDQARVIVRAVDIIPSDRPAGRIDAIQGSPKTMRFAWVVTFQPTEVLRGRFDKKELRILVHSPSADLGVRGKSNRGILHR